MSDSGKGGESGRSNDSIKQQMIKELTDLGMYEDNMTIDDMTQFLQAVQNSKNTANQGVRNENVNKTPEQTRQDMQPCYSRSLNAKGSSERASMSPELPADQLRKSFSQEKRSDSSEESMFSPQSRNPFLKENKEILERGKQANINKRSINENSSKAIDNKSVQRANLLMRSLEAPKWRFNPLDVEINPNDVPLQPRYRMLPEKDCADVGTSVNIDKAVAQLSNHLQRVCESWHAQHGSSGKTNAPWGKAIQVGTDNGSLDKEFVPDTTSQDAGTSETNVNLDNDRRRRAAARKVIDYTAGEGNSDSDDDFMQASSSKRRKSTKRSGSSEKTNLPKESSSTRNSKSILERDDLYEWEQLIEDPDSDTELQKSPQKTKNRKGDDAPDITTLPTETASKETTRGRRKVTKKDDIYEWEEDNKVDSDEESKKDAKRMKRTKSSTRKVMATRTTRQKSVEPVSSNASEKQDDSPVCLDDSDENVICVTKESNQLVQKPQTSRPEEAVSSTSSSYPRRIIPPNPNRKFAGIRARKPLFDFTSVTRGKKQTEQDKKDDEEVSRTNRKGGNSSLFESEIAEILEKPDEEDLTSPVDTEFKPLRISDRMKKQVQHLKTLRKEEEQSKLQRSEEERIKQEIAQREKEDRIKQRLKEEKEKARREELEAKAKERTEAHWNNHLKQTGKKRFERTELNPEGPRQNSDIPIVEVGRENRFETEQNDVEMVNDDDEQPSQRVPCPICGQKFRSEQIEDHAASCEEYGATNSAGTSRSNSPAFSTRSTTNMRRSAPAKFECVVCSLFTSNDGKKFEDHVNKCVARHRDGVAAGPSTVVEVPDSPIRSVRKVSEIADSEINYKRQFVPKTKSQVNENRKRKRL